MYRRLILPLLLASLTGCGSGPTDYLVKTYADDFEGVTTWRLEGNTIADTIHNDHYLRVEFDVQKTVFRDSGVAYAIMIGYLSSDWLFVEEGESLVMLVDGARIGFTGEGSGRFRQVGTGGVVSELAFYPLTRETLVRISHAREVRIKVIGEKYSLERGLMPSNIEHLRRFVGEY